MTTLISSDRSTRQRWLEGGLIVGFWICIFVLTVGQRAIDPRGPEGLAPQEALHAGLEFAVWLLLTPGIFWLARRFSLERETWVRNAVLHLGVALIVAILINAFAFATFLALIAPEWHTRPFSFVSSVRSLRFLDELIIYLFVLAVGFARDFFLRYRERQAEAVQLRTQAVALHAQLAEARLQTLRMQLNPHFLFNTLHAVSSLVERDPRGVRRMIARLSELLRYTLESTGAQEVPLHQEIQFLEDYLEIQRIRFQGKLEVTIEIDAEMHDALVPNLILQPIVENAIKHGVSPLEGTGRLGVRAWRVGESLHLSVRDNGPGLPSSDGLPGGREGVGLRNTRERLENLYGTAQRLSLEPAEGGGLEVHIMLPFHTAADLRTTSLHEEVTT